jgi:hypothetical protein
MRLEENGYSLVVDLQRLNTLRLEQIKGMLHIDSYKGYRSSSPYSMLINRLFAPILSIVIGIVTGACSPASEQVSSTQNISTPAQSTGKPSGSSQTATVNSNSPSEVVRTFYSALRDKRFKDAFSLSIYKPAIDPLTPAEFEELRPDFEKTAGIVPPSFTISGEQISGDVATVFIKIGEQVDNVYLIKDGNRWIVGDKKDQEEVKRYGKEFFFKKRIEVHHLEAEDILSRISTAQITYHVKNKRYADLPTLINAGLLPKDIDAIGYHFTIYLSKDGQSYKVTAEPVRYNRTGTYSFYMDQSGIKKKDAGGKSIKE